MRPSAGVILYYSRDPLHIAVGDQLLAIITDAGWQATEFQKTLPSGPGEQMDFDHCMLMLFIVPETEQLSNPREVINEFFGLCGFSPVSEDTETLRGKNRHLITFHVPAVVHRNVKGTELAWSR
jgi:hypothetical protein